MSVKQMGIVWELDLPHNQLWVLMALADHASHDGRRVFPSVPLLAWKTGYCERQVQRILRQLEKPKILVVTGNRRGGKYPTEYELRLDNAPRKGALPTGDKMSPPPVGEAQALPPEQLGETPNVTPAVTSMCHPSGDIQMSPEPSVNRPVTISPSDSLRSSGASAGVDKSNTRGRTGDAVRLSDAMRQAAGAAPKEDPLHSKRSRLMGELREHAWLNDDPPAHLSQRASEGDILTGLLRYVGETDIKAAIHGLRLILGEGVPFSAKLLRHDRMFRWGQDAFYHRLGSTLLPQVKAAILQALAA